MKKLNPTLLLSLLTAFVLSVVISCSPSKNSDSEEITEMEVIEEPIPVWVVAEHHINTIPVTSKGKITKPSKSTPVKAEPNSNEDAAEVEVAEEVAMEEEYDIIMQEELEAALLEAEYEAMNTITVTEAIVPLDETQTVVSYNSKGKAKDTVQVVSNGDGSVDQIVFTHKHHKDIYDVENGMTAKEAKKLRKELKHMVKNGKVFLYTDDSNVMYMLQEKDGLGDEIDEAEVDQLEVQAIIWKDKKHHKKNK